MKGRTLQACSLKHSIKKEMFFLFMTKLKLFKSGRGEYSPLPLLSYTPALELLTSCICHIFSGMSLCLTMFLLTTLYTKWWNLISWCFWKVQQEKSTAWEKCNMKRVELENNAMRKRVTWKIATWKCAIWRKSAIWKKWNARKVQYEKSIKWKECDMKRVNIGNMQKILLCSI